MDHNKEKYQSILTASLNHEKLYRVEKIKQELQRENLKLLKSLFGSSASESCKGSIRYS